MTAVLLCPGQGAQTVGMGKDLAEQFEPARRVFDAVDEALGASLSRLMWEGPEAELTLTHNAQPAILAHSLAVLAVMRQAVRPVAAAGHSLGEYSAYAAAESLDLADAARLVRRRGELMFRAGEERPGAMAAVLGMAVEQVEEACAAASTADSPVVAANVNAPDQVVISGAPAAVDGAAERCRIAGAKRVLPLKVSGAFHSPLMQPAQDGLALALGQVSFRDPAFPVVANASAEPVGSAGDARRLLERQLTAPVRWVECMRVAHSLAGSDATFVEIGPGGVLRGLLKRVVPEARAVSLSSAKDVTQFLEAA